MREPPTAALLRPAPVWEIAGGSLPLAAPIVAGILNVTPDSFSDGGETTTVEAAMRRGEEMVRAGAGLLDVGGESTRPGASAVPVEEELRRVVPVVEALARCLPVPISVDTRKSQVARAALGAGASIVNDVSGLSFDPALAAVVADSGAGVILMHMRGTPGEMRSRARYSDLAGEVRIELERSVVRARGVGIRPASIVLDPGLGFAKSAAQSVEILGELPRLLEAGFPMMVGPSRKSFLGALLGVPPKARAVGTAAACVIAYQGGARLFRVHDVRPAVEALVVAHAVARAGTGGWEGP